MYVEVLADLPFGDWVRTCVSVPCRQNGPPGTSNALAAILSFGRTVAGLAVSFRIRYEPGQPLRREFIFLAPISSEEALRRFVARFTRLELVTGQVAELPSSATHLDELLGQFPRWRSRVLAAPEGDGDPWFLPEFTLLPDLEQLLWNAGALYAGLSYQANFWPSLQSTDSLRQCSYNLLRAARVAGIPEGLLAMQKRVESQVRAAEYVAEEFIGVGSLEVAGTIGQQISELFGRKHGPLRFPKARFPFLEGAFEDSIDSGFHTSAIAASSPPQSWVEACSYGRILESAAWNPDHWIELAIPEAAPTPFQSEPSTTLPAIQEPGTGDYVFVSYSRSDGDLVSSLLRAMEQQGVQYWYDQHIPGAADWHEMLEDRINHCSFFVLMLSPPAADSRYVRRELAFADSLNKPILTVRLAPTDLTRGLAMRLSEYQMIDGNALQFSSEFAMAIAFLRSEKVQARA